MKNVLRVLILAAAVLSFTLPALAQDASSSAAAPSAQEVQAKADLYAKFLKEKAGDAASQKQASQTGQEYVSKYGAAADEAVKKASTDAEKSAAEADKKIVDYIRGWVGKYEKAVRDFACTDAFNKNDYAKVFPACQVILNEQPDNIDIVLLLARSGFLNANSTTPNKSLNADAARMARRAIELIQSGKAPAKWEPFPNREEALGFLYYTLGLVTQETSPSDATTAYIKAAQSNSPFKSQPSTFINLGNIYLTTELKKLADEYTAAFPPGNPIPDEKKAQSDQMLEQLKKVQDRIIDAFARAAALMGNDPKYAADKKNVMARLTTYYKARHESEAGLQELVNNVLSRPIPIPGQEPATPSTPAASSGMNGTGGAATTPVGQPVASPSTPAAGTAPKPAATPATTPAKPAVTTTAPASTTPKPKPISKKAAPAAKSSRARKTTSGR